MSDGVTHINVYSRGETKLGRMLSNFYRAEFTYPPYGTFASVEGFWYYYLTGAQHDHLKLLWDFRAKQEGRKLRDDRIDKNGLSEENKTVILEAIRCKLRQNRYILRELTESTLPLEHYYLYHGAKVYQPQYGWMIDELSRIRGLMKEHNGGV